MNILIPKDFNYSRSGEKRTELYDKAQIQKYVPFEEKIKIIIPSIKNRSFQQDFSHKFSSILKLKEFRDEIIHTKALDNKAETIYQGLFTTSLNFDYKKTIYDVRDFLNYYEPGIIEECDCGKDDF
jgi:hypothetical protein